MNSFLLRLLNQLLVKTVRGFSRKAGAGALVVMVVALLGVSLFELPANAGNDTTSAFSLSGKVVHVSDGDTFNLLVNGRTERIRMASIDAPEIGKGNQQPGQPYGQASRQALSDLIAGKTVVLQCFERDRYERAICDVGLSDGTTANQRQVRQGMAWANTEKRGQFLRDSSLPELQQQARRQGLGLWRDAHPVEPWAWRYHCWRQQQC